jgi:inosine-uridine nucleoside N-ribohydrolase
VGKLVAELMDFYARFHRRAYTDLLGSPMHDPVAVAHVLRPGLVDVRHAFITVDCGWDQGRGRTNVDWRGREGGSPPNGEVGLGIDPDVFARLVIERVTSLG